MSKKIEKASFVVGVISGTALFIKACCVGYEDKLTTSKLMPYFVLCGVVLFSFVVMTVCQFINQRRE